MRLSPEELGRRMCLAWHRVDHKPGSTAPCGEHLRLGTLLAPVLTDQRAVLGAGLAYALEVNQTDVLGLGTTFVVSGTRLTSLLEAEEATLASASVSDG